VFTESSGFIVHLGLVVAGSPRPQGALLFSRRSWSSLGVKSPLVARTSFRNHFGVECASYVVPSVPGTKAAHSAHVRHPSVGFVASHVSGRQQFIGQGRVGRARGTRFPFPFVFTGLPHQASRLIEGLGVRSNNALQRTRYARR
jgi:hypothetical protein